MNHFACVLAVGLSCVSASLLCADEPAAAAPSESDIRELIKQLDHDEFATRKAADDRLAKIGVAAVPVLEENVRNKSFEVASRSFDILQRIFASQDTPSKEAAKGELERLAKTDDTIGRQSKKILNPPPLPTPEQTPEARLGGVRIRAGIAAPIVAAAVKRAVRVEAMDGDKKVIALQEDDRSIKFSETADKIEGEFSKKEGEKQTSEKFVVKNAEELKTKHPEAFRMYEQAGKGAVVKVEFGGVARAIPAAIPIEVKPAADIKKLQLESRKSLLKVIDDQIAKIKASTDLPDDQKATMIDALQKSRDSAAAALEKLEKTDAEKKK